MLKFHDLFIASKILHCTYHWSGCCIILTLWKILLKTVHSSVFWNRSSCGRGKIVWQMKNMGLLKKQLLSVSRNQVANRVYYFLQKTKVISNNLGSPLHILSEGKLFTVKGCKSFGQIHLDDISVT